MTFKKIGKQKTKTILCLKIIQIKNKQINKDLWINKVKQKNYNKKVELNKKRLKFNLNRDSKNKLESFKTKIKIIQS